MTDPDAKIEGLKAAGIGVANGVAWGITASDIQTGLSLLLTLLSIVYVAHQLVYLRRKMQSKQDN